MIAAAAAAGPATAVAAPSDAACMRAIRSAPRRRVDARCWRVGPLRIGMTRPEVEAQLGPPDVKDAVGDEVAGVRVSRPHAVYIFPRDLASRLARDPQPSFRFEGLELTYRDGRLVRIGNEPPVRSSGPACARSPAEPDAARASDPGFLPYRRFLGVKVGDRLGDWTRRLGPWESISRGGDFVNFFRIPVTLGVDEAPPTSRKRVRSFAIGADGDTVTEGGWVDVAVDRDPASCRVRGFRFVTPPAGG